MSEYISIKINDFELWSWRNTVDELFSLFFTNDDLVITEKYKEFDDEDCCEYTKYEFISTVSNVMDRFDALGLSISKFNLEFQNKKYIALNYDGLLKHMKVNEEDYNNVIRNRVDKYVTIDKYKNTLRKVIKYEKQYGNILIFNEFPNGIPISSETDKIMLYESDSYDNNGFYGIKIQEFDIRLILRLILSCFDANEKIVADVSNVVGWTYDSIDEIMPGDKLEKNIVLVEGSSDKDYLEFAMKRIYPHVYNLFYFMDFEYSKQNNRAGSVSEISRNIQTFVCSKLKAKFIAIYDNDTAGIQAKRKLLASLDNIPSNFRILNYPDLEFAKKYPTICTTKKRVYDDINGRACSIEMYLPDEAIKVNSEYLPIEWNSRLEVKINGQSYIDYQGVITQKDSVKHRFNKIMNNINNEEDSFENYNWSRMKQLLDIIVFAFRD